MNISRVLLFTLGALWIGQVGAQEPAGRLEQETASPTAAAVPVMIGMGDSIGEAVQSADANLLTQPNSYLNLIAAQIGTPFALPLIQSGPFGFVGVTTNRSRVDPTVLGDNLAVSGADASSILFDRADAVIDSETDLVLSPRTGSQIEIAESLNPPLIICWIGNNDVLGAIIAFNQLDASQMTPATQFAASYTQLIQRLAALDSKVVVANIPDVTHIAYLVNRDDLIRFLGNDFGLPEGSYTSVVAMLMIKIGLKDPSILQDPNWVLSPGEVQTIQARLQTFNAIIAARAADAGMPVVDVNTLLNTVSNNPPIIGGVALTTRYLGGMFSLDGVHPSNIGHAVLANAFIQRTDAFYHSSIPPLTGTQLVQIFYADPFVDFDGDLKVQGRPFAGLLETLGPTLGISGDLTPMAASTSPKIDKTLGRQFMREYLRLKGRDPETAWDEQDAVEAMREVFGLNNLLRR